MARASKPTIMPIPPCRNKSAMAIERFDLTAGTVSVRPIKKTAARAAAVCMDNRADHTKTKCCTPALLGQYIFSYAAIMHGMVIQISF